MRSVNVLKIDPTDVVKCLNHFSLSFLRSISYEKVGRKALQIDPIKSQIPSKTSRWKKDSTKRHQKDIISDSQVNSYFPYRWSPASLSFNVYFYLFLYLYITRITINNDTPHLKSPKNQNRSAALGRPAIKLLGGFN